MLAEVLGCDCQTPRVGTALADPVIQEHQCAAPGGRS